MEFDPPTSKIKKRKGANLPHWTKEGSWYSITFRLWDSLPKSVLNRLLFEREYIVKTARQMNWTLNERQLLRLQRLHSEKVDSYLDASSGACYLRNEKIAEVVANSIQKFETERYQLATWCVMPNHVHVVLRPVSGYELEDILHSWKSFSATESNKILRRKGGFWQWESYDHLIRDEDDFLHAVNYVLKNPTNAGLKNWKWVKDYGVEFYF